MAGSPPTPRTTAALVQGVNPGIDDNIDLSPFIALANQLVTDVCGPLITGMDSQGNKVTVDSSYTDGFIGSKMELIERWLAAHFYTIYDNQLAEARAGSVGARFSQLIGFGLKLTQFGSSAMLADTSGRLAALANVDQTKRKIRIGGFWTAKKCSPAEWGLLWADLTTEM